MAHVPSAFKRWWNEMWSGVGGTGGGAISQTVTNGDTTHAPSGNAVNDFVAAQLGAENAGSITDALPLVVAVANDDKGEVEQQTLEMAGAGTSAVNTNPLDDADFYQMVDALNGYKAWALTSDLTTALVQVADLGEGLKGYIGPIDAPYYKTAQTIDNYNVDDSNGNWFDGFADGELVAIGANGGLAPQPTVSSIPRMFGTNLTNNDTSSLPVATPDADSPIAFVRLTPVVTVAGAGEPALDGDYFDSGLQQLGWAFYTLTGQTPDPVNNHYDILKDISNSYWALTRLDGSYAYVSSDIPDNPVNATWIVGGDGNAVGPAPTVTQGTATETDSQTTRARVCGRLEVADATARLALIGLLRNDEVYQIDTGFWYTLIDATAPSSAGSWRYIPAFYSGLLLGDLPVAPGQGDTAIITNANQTGWGEIVTGGGFDTVLAWFDGANWTVLGVPGS